MKAKLIVVALSVISLPLLAAERVDFSGTWEFNPQKSKNVGMMAQMKMSLTTSKLMRQWISPRAPAIRVRISKARLTST
jgi:type IV secretory pathway protease TraF